MNVSAFDHPLLSGLLGDDEAAAYFSADADIAEMLRFEVALAQSQAEEGVISDAAAAAVAKACKNFKPDMKRLREDTTRDGVMVPGLVRQIRERIAKKHADSLHRGPTSQDLIDTSLVLRLRGVASIIDRRLEEVQAGLDKLTETFGDSRLVARTRMQRALDIHVSDRVATWSGPLVRSRQYLSDSIDNLCWLQMGGPSGKLETTGKWPDVKERMGAALDLPVPPNAWHSQRDRLTALASCLAGITGNLGKMGQDIALMAQDEIAEVELPAGGGSSSMPHKNNPIAAEILVTLARYNAVQVSAMFHALVHEQERSGAAWTLEWMVLPPICVATAAALARANELIGGVSGMGTPKD